MDEIFRIVKIVDVETIVINAGSENNIKIGDKFEIFEIGQEITDPETGIYLGTLDNVKETVQAVNVFPNLTICRHIQNVSLLPINSHLNFTRTQNKTLNVDTTQISGGLPVGSTIKIGDKVRKIILTN